MKLSKLELSNIIVSISFNRNILVNGIDSGIKIGVKLKDSLLESLKNKNKEYSTRFFDSIGIQFKDYNGFTPIQVILSERNKEIKRMEVSSGIKIAGVNENT